MKHISYLTLALSSLATLSTNVYGQTVTTTGADEITSTSANFNGNANPDGCEYYWVFEWGTTTSYGNWGPNGIYGSPFGCLDNQIHVNWVCTGLQPNTAYHCRLDIYGPTRYYYGGDTNFTTLPLAPTVSTEAATITNAFSVVLAGSVNPNGATTTAWYQWGLDASCTNSTAATSLGNGNGSFNVPYTLTNLSASTRYYYQIVAGNRGGTNNGAIQSVTTGPPPPPVIQSIAWRSGEISFSWQSIVGQTYQVQYSTNLTNWSDTGTPLSANSTFYDLAVGACRFYRVALIRSTN